MTPPEHALPVRFALRIAATPWQRMRGLLGYPALRDEEGLLIKPCNMIHTFGMRYCIDAVFIDRQFRILKIASYIAPLRMRQCLFAHAVLELAAGRAESLNLHVGEPLPDYLRHPAAAAAGSAPNHQRGQSAAEFLIIFPVLIFLVFGIIQWALIYQARSTLNHAAFLAARAGALHHGSQGDMRSALAAGLTPLFASQASDTGYAQARARAESETVPGLVTLQILNPTREAMNDFFSRNRLDNGPGKEIPNDTLMYRNPAPGGSSGMSVQDANILHIRVTYCYRLIMPVVGRMIRAVANAQPTAEVFQATGMSRPFGAIDAPPAAGCVDPQGDQTPRIPIRTEAVVRMQSSFWAVNLP